MSSTSFVANSVLLIQSFRDACGTESTYSRFSTGLREESFFYLHYAAFLLEMPSVNNCDVLLVLDIRHTSRCQHNLENLWPQCLNEVVQFSLAPRGLILETMSTFPFSPFIHHELC